MKHIIFCLALLPTPALSDCPALPDRRVELDDIYAQLLGATNEAQAQALSAQLWEIWLQAPDDKAQGLLDAGMEQRQRFNYLAARDMLDQLVEYCPDYAEGYNQRAFASFLRQDFAAALYDLDQALALNPRHLGALTGKGLTLLGMEQESQAQKVLRDALKLNPWLAERALLLGTDI